MLGCGTVCSSSEVFIASILKYFVKSFRSTTWIFKIFFVVFLFFLTCFQLKQHLKRYIIRKLTQARSRNPSSSLSFYGSSFTRWRGNVQPWHRELAATAGEAPGTLLEPDSYTSPLPWWPRQGKMLWSPAAPCISGRYKWHSKLTTYSEKRGGTRAFVHQGQFDVPLPVPCKASPPGGQRGGLPRDRCTWIFRKPGWNSPQSISLWLWRLITHSLCCCVFFKLP